MHEAESAAPSQLVPDRQRVRITFARGENARYVGHLDMVRTWERIIRRAGLPMAYSEGFNPRPRLTFAAALPVGCTSQQEVLDVVLSPPIELAAARSRLAGALPAGIDVVALAEIPYSAPALPTQARAAEYLVTFLDPVLAGEAQAGVQALLDAPAIERARRGKAYDLRPLILDAWLEQDEAGRPAIGMRLRHEAGATGRPDEVIAAMGWDPAAARIHRRQLEFA